LSPAVSRGYWNACEDLSCKKGFIIYPGNERYPVGRNVFAMPVRELARIL